MAKQEDRIERVTDFRSRHLPSAFLIADKSIVLLGELIATLEAAPTFSLAHIQAMVLAITLCEFSNTGLHAARYRRSIHGYRHRESTDQRHKARPHAT